MLDTTQLSDHAGKTAPDFRRGIDSRARAESRKQSLRRRHSRVNMEVMVEHQRPLPDRQKLLALKRKRLAIKDELYRLERQTTLNARELEALNSRW